MHLSSYWAHRGHRSVLSEQSSSARTCLDCGVLVMSEDMSPVPREFKLTRLPAHSISAAQSVEVFDIRGERLHNTGGTFKIAGFVGHCCDRESLVHLHMSAQATVISSHPIEAAPKRVTVSIGDVLRVDYSYYRLVNRVRRLADPVLIPVGFAKGEGF